MFTGRVVQPGEPEFLREDTDLALALAEEEADTCSSCGFPKAWCRDPRHQFSFDADESVCWPSYRLAQHRAHTDFDKKDETTRAAVQLAARFRSDPAHQPNMLAGLDLPEEGG